jgi:hypothetical protein
MTIAWADLVEQGGNAELEASRWQIEYLLQAEAVKRHMRSNAHQSKVVRFPVYRDLAGLNFDASQVDRALVHKLADLSFTQDAQNVVLIVGAGTGNESYRFRHSTNEAKGLIRAKEQARKTKRKALQDDN